MEGKEKGRGRRKRREVARESIKKGDEEREKIKKWEKVN